MIGTAALGLAARTTAEDGGNDQSIKYVHIIMSSDKACPSHRLDHRPRSCFI